MLVLQSKGTAESLISAAGYTVRVGGNEERRPIKGVSNALRILLAFGTRPEIVKLGPVVQALKQTPGVKLDVFWTGQHVELADGLLQLFDIEVTHSGSNIVSQSGLAGKFGFMAQQIESVLQENRYDWVVVQGDTATAAAAATAGFLNRVPVGHVEAGLRTRDLSSPWPEEFNRRAIALCSTVHFAPTVAARNNLLAEGVPADKVLVVGNTVVDALLYARDKIGGHYRPVDPAVAALPQDKKLILATLHRRENIGRPLRQVLLALRELGADGDKLIVLPVHLNPQVRFQVIETLGDARMFAFSSRFNIPTLSTSSARHGWSSPTRAACRRRRRPLACRCSLPARRPKDLRLSKPGLDSSSDPKRPPSCAKRGR
jgi:UDP-N-acetylglucosamine 2-epimerase